MTDAARREEPIRGQMLAGVLRFVRAVEALAGVRRIALIGSIVTTKPNPKDVDLRVTVADDADLAPLARVMRTRKIDPGSSSFDQGAVVDVATTVLRPALRCLVRRRASVLDAAVIRPRTAFRRGFVLAVDPVPLTDLIACSCFVPG